MEATINRHDICCANEGVIMKKISSKNIPCTYCEADAVPETDPPVCVKHEKLVKQAKKEGKTLKELESEHA